MQYFLHKEAGHVVSLEDKEPADLAHLGSDPSDYMPVHLHPGPGAMHSEPKTWAKVVAVTASLALVAGLLALLGAGAVAAWNAVL